MAQDKGYPPLSRTVEVQIDVVDRANNPPVWDHVVYGPIFIRENLPVGAKVVSVKARSVCAPTTSMCYQKPYIPYTCSVRPSTPLHGTVVCLCTLHPSHSIIYNYNIIYLNKQVHTCTIHSSLSSSSSCTCSFTMSKVCTIPPNSPNPTVYSVKCLYFLISN